MPATLQREAAPGGGKPGLQVEQPGARLAEKYSTNADDPAVAWLLPPPNCTVIPHATIAIVAQHARARRHTVQHRETQGDTGRRTRERKHPSDLPQATMSSKTFAVMKYAPPHASRAPKFALPSPRPPHPKQAPIIAGRAPTRPPLTARCRRARYDYNPDPAHALEQRNSIPGAAQPAHSKRAVAPNTLLRRAHRQHTSVTRWHEP